MAKEIERKFLVKNDSWQTDFGAGVEYRQAYIRTVGNATVRLRTAGDKAYLTLKGPSSQAARDEYEYEIPFADALEMLQHLCDTPIVHKTRYTKKYDNYEWVIDVFHDENAPLVMAEIEFYKTECKFNLPAWAGQEVTEDFRYTNASLSLNPYGSWG
jgi:adenylate cyclase